MKNKLPLCNIRFVFQSKCNIITFLYLKTEFYRSNVLAMYINFSVVTAMLPTHNFKLRMCEHPGILALTRKIVKGDGDSAIKNIFFL